MKKIYLATIAFLSLACVPTSQAATSTDCATLGYNVAAANFATTCAGKNILKCPFDNSKGFCGTSSCGVTVGTYEICTTWCPGQTNVACQEKRTATCDEYINSVNAYKRKGYKVAAGGKIPKREFYQEDIYLMGSATVETAGVGSLTLKGINVYAAADIPACAAAGAVAGTLDLGYVYLQNYIIFNVPTKFMTTHNANCGSTCWGATFTKGSNEVRVDMYGSNFWSTSLELGFSGTKNKVNLSCDWSSGGDSSCFWNRTMCNASISGDVSVCYSGDCGLCWQDGRSVAQGCAMNLSVNAQTPTSPSSFCNHY